MNRGSKSGWSWRARPFCAALISLSVTMGPAAVYGVGRTGAQTQARQAMVRGNNAYQAKNYKEAEREFLQAVGYDATLTDAFEKLAAIYYQDGRHGPAAALLRRGLSSNPGHAALMAWLGLHLLKLRKVSEAVRLLELAVRKDYKLFLAQVKLGGHYM